MDIKIIATDLDGTLMSRDHLTVTEYTKQTLLKAHNKGIKIAIATGRPLSLIDSVTEQVPFADFVIYSNGACVYDRNKNEIICSDLIDNDTVRRMLAYFLNEKVFFEIYIDGRSHYQSSTDAYYDPGELPPEFIDEIVGTMTEHADLLAFVEDQPIEKITMYSIKNDRFLKYADKLKEYGLAVTTSLKESLEATALTANKGNALKGICDTFGFLPSQVMSFGDAGNDCPMLDYAEHSFAMENGSDECKAHAKHIAKSNAEDGVAQAVEKYCL